MNITILYLISFLMGTFLSFSHLFSQTMNTNTRVIRVGPGERYLKSSEVSKVVNDGDIIEIEAGIYTNDIAIWRNNNLTIRGTGGKAHFKANGSNAEGKAIWVVKGNNIIIENIEFSDASVPDENGAGIRHEGGLLIIRNCYFHHNENGILAGGNPDREVIIENSEFSHNGFGDGKSHNIYIGNIKKFTIKYSYIHHAYKGHNVKSRANNNYILYNRIMDEEDGMSSYAIDMPNGGLSFIQGNLIQQGINTENPHIISYGAERLKNLNNEIYVVNNTIVNQRSTGVFIRVSNDTKRAFMANNLLIGRGQISKGPVEKITNLHIEEVNSIFSVLAKTPAFFDMSKYDYRIKSNSDAIDMGSELTTINGFDLTPTWQYKHPLQKEKRKIKEKIDVGAYEYMDMD